MKAIVSSLQSGKFELEKEFLLGNNFFGLSWDLFLEQPSNYSLSLSTDSFNLTWSSNSNNLSNLFSIKESELNLNTWYYFKLIYIPAIGILYYKNNSLINTFKIELKEDCYKIKMNLNEYSKTRNLLLNPINNFDKLLLHFNDLNLDNNIWTTSGNLATEQSNNSHFGKCIKLYPGSEILLNPNLSSGIVLDKSDFTLDFYIQSNSSLNCNINLFSKVKKSNTNFINLEFSNKKLISLTLKDNNLILDSNISKVTHIALVYHHKISTIYLFINGILELSSEFYIDKKDNYFLYISSSGTFCLDEFHICSGLAYWINDFILSKYPYLDSVSINKFIIPSNIKSKFISNSGINYQINSEFSIIKENTILIKTIWKSDNLTEFNNFIKNIFSIDSNNYFSHKSDLIELAESSINSCKRYLNNLLGNISVPDNISEIYINKSGISILISIEFTRKIISREIEFVDYLISYELDEKSILFKETSFKITSNNYKNYYSELMNQINSEISLCKSYLDSISNSKIYLGNSGISLINNKGNLFLENNPSINLNSNNKILRLNLQRRKI